jgi:hypothetical protein
MRKMSSGKGGQGGVESILKIVNLNTNGISQLTTLYHFANGHSICVHPVLIPY